jgi:hypothetical protein
VEKRKLALFLCATALLSTAISISSSTSFAIPLVVTNEDSDGSQIPQIPSEQPQYNRPPNTDQPINDPEKPLKSLSLLGHSSSKQVLRLVWSVL